MLHNEIRDAAGHGKKKREGRERHKPTKNPQ